MGNPKHKLDTGQLMSFLLGEMEDAESTKVEAMFLADESLREELELAKSQLFEMYKTGTLSLDQSGRFEKRFLGEFADEKKRFESMLASNEEARARGETNPPPMAAAPAVPARQDPRPQRLSQGPTLVGATPMPAAAPAAQTSARRWIFLALFLVIGAGVALLALSDSGSSGSKSAEIKLSGFSLQGKSQVIALPSAERVQLLLPLRAGVSSFPEYRVALLEGESRSELASTVGEDGVVRVEVAPAELGTARYDLELSGVGAEGPEVLGYYSFQKKE